MRAAECGMRDAALHLDRGAIIEEHRGSPLNAYQRERERERSATEYERLLAAFEAEAQSVQLIEVEGELDELRTLVESSLLESEFGAAASLADTFGPSLMMVSSALCNLQLSASTQHLELLNNRRDVTRAEESAVREREVCLLWQLPRMAVPNMAVREREVCLLWQLLYAVAP